MIKKNLAGKSFLDFIFLLRKILLFFVDSFIAKLCVLAQIKITHKFKIKCRKLVVALIFLFTVSFSFVLFFAVFDINKKQDAAFFADIPLDHQIYNDLASLLQLEGCLDRGNNYFAPYEAITTKEFNHALTTIIRFYKVNFSKDLLLDTKSVSAENLGRKMQNLAVIVGKENKFEQISYKRLNNLTRMNIYGLLEQVFLKNEYQEPFI